MHEVLNHKAHTEMTIEEMKKYFDEFFSEYEDSLISYEEKGEFYLKIPDSKKYESDHDVYLKLCKWMKEYIDREKRREQYEKLKKEFEG